MDYIITRDDGSEALYHHGIKGMHWGIRRYQNADGSYTEAGKKRYAKYDKKNRKGKKIAAVAATTAIAALASIGIHKALKGSNVSAAGKKIAKETIKEIGEKAPKAISETVMSSGKTAATVLLTGGLIYAGEKAIEKNFGNEPSKRVVEYGRKPIVKK